MTQWHHKSFDQLNVTELYDILKLRQDVFVIEQQCIYPELDDTDQTAMHLYAYIDGKIAAYARLFAPGIKYAQSAIGRVVIHPSARGGGLGKDVMVESIQALERDYPDAGIKISAQLYLQAFYEGLGFVLDSEPYDDEGIMHIDMVKAPVAI